jgi:tetrahydromethanopterin S-methyltransferase subunit B
MTTTDKVELAEVEGRLIQQMATERTILREDMVAMESRLTERIYGLEVGLAEVNGKVGLVIERVDRLEGKVDLVVERVNSLEGKVDQVLKKLGD